MMAFTILKTITTTSLVPVEVVEVRCQYGMVPDPCVSCGHTGGPDPHFVAFVREAGEGLQSVRLCYSCGKEAAREIYERMKP
jgi:hypothetical protein